MQRAADLVKIEAENVVIGGVLGANGRLAGGIQARIQLPLVGIEPGAVSHQRGRQKTAEDRGEGEGSQFTDEFV